MATNTWPGGLAGGLTQLLIPPTAPKAGTKIRRKFVELHELLPECLAESNGLYWADSKVKGKEEAQGLKCMFFFFFFFFFFL